MAGAGGKRRKDEAVCIGAVAKRKIVLFWAQCYHYADLKWGGGKYTNGKSSSQDDIIARYHSDIAQGMEPLPFVFYVPPGFAGYPLPRSLQIGTLK